MEHAPEFIVEGTTSTSETATRGAYRILYGAETSVLASDVKARVDALTARPEVSLVEVSPVTRRGIFGHPIKGEPVAILARMLDGGFSIVWISPSINPLMLSAISDLFAVMEEYRARIAAAMPRPAAPAAEAGRVEIAPTGTWRRVGRHDARSIGHEVMVAGASSWDLHEGVGEVMLFVAWSDASDPSGSMPWRIAEALYVGLSSVVSTHGQERVDHVDGIGQRRTYYFTRIPQGEQVEGAR